MKTRRFHSAATSPGIAIGHAHRVLNRGTPSLRTWIKDLDVDLEVGRFRNAIQSSKEQLDKIQAKMCRFQGQDQIKIIESYRLFLQDDMLVATTIDHIIKYKINAEWALDKTLAHLKLSFINVDEEFFKERQQDIDYVGRRVMDNLIGNPEISISEIPNKTVILIAHDISPAEVASLPRDRVQGFVMEMGGETSHSAIISRALEIPSVFGVKRIFEQIEDGELVIIDGMKGLVIASPYKKELEQYKSIQGRYAALEKLLLQDIHLPAKTKDNHRIVVEANMELVEEIDSLLEHGAEGVGLYRTEYLFLNRLDEPSEEEQFENYIEVLKKFSPKPVTIRTIDLGGDKIPMASQIYDTQSNPALGIRAIRLCLRELPLFKMQLRALFRASVHGDLRILLPMISSLDELLIAKRVIDDVKRDLKKRGLPFNENVPVGIMIEVPSAVFIADILAKEADFFSIGTNDLIQYGLAIDRVNELVSYLYNPFHPAVLRMIKHTVEAASQEGIKVSLCGEMAGNPISMALLVGMELDGLSMNAISIPRVKKMLRSITKKEANELLEEALKLHTADEVEKLLKERMEGMMPGEVKKLGDLESKKPRKRPSKTP